MEIVTKEMFEQFAKQMKEEFKGLKDSLIKAKLPKYLKNKDVMEIVGCSYGTLEKLRNSNTLPYKRVLGTYYYEVNEVERIFGVNTY